MRNASIHSLHSFMAHRRKRKKTHTKSIYLKSLYAHNSNQWSRSLCSASVYCSHFQKKKKTAEFVSVSSTISCFKCTLFFFQFSWIKLNQYPLINRSSCIFLASMKTKLHLKIRLFLFTKMKSNILILLVQLNWIEWANKLTNYVPLESLS